MASDEDITANIIYFIFNGKTLWLVQFVKNGPKCLWLYSQSCIRFEDFEKQNALKTRNTEKGIPGITIPTYAIPKEMMPAVSQRYLFILKHKQNKETEY